MALATICFAGLDATAKYLVVAKQRAGLQARGCASSAISCSARSRCGLRVKASLPLGQARATDMRSVIMIVTTGFNFLSLRFCSSTRPSLSSFSRRSLVAALAGPLLHEWIGWHRALAVFAGFIGVLIVMHPGFGTLHWAMLLSLTAMLGYALYNLATRYLAAFDPPEVTQTYTPLAGAVIMAPFALAAWQWPQDGMVWLLFASLGFWGGLGHWLLILAHRIAPAPALAPFIYLGLIWMSAAGYFVFGNVPTLWTLSGAGVVILSGLYLLARERARLGPRAVGPASDIAVQ